MNMTSMTTSSAGDLSRRRLLLGCAACLVPAALPRMVLSAGGQTTNTPGTEPYNPALLPPSVRSRFLDNVNGLRMHVLESGFDGRDRPTVILLHGFPELAYSWRKVMPAFAAAGFHVVAPDLRGYGRTSGWDVRYDDDLRPFRTLNEVRDILALVFALGRLSVQAVIGHDYGSPIAAWCGVVRPDVFRAVAMMSGPFAGPPRPPADGSNRTEPPESTPRESVYDELSALTPSRKHYQRYYSTREANDNMRRAPQGIHAFLRAYYHMKSADWTSNKPFPLKSWTAEELGTLPRYYVMDADKGMAETVAPAMPPAAEIASCKWLPDAELAVYSAEYARTGFQGGLQGYRVGTSGRYTADPQNAADLQTFAGRTLDVPALFIGGRSDWGVYQRPGALENMQARVCTRLMGTHLVAGAGHWVQQEQPEEVSRLLLQFLRDARGAA